MKDKIFAYSVSAISFGALGLIFFDALADTATNIDNFFSPEGEVVTAATYPTAETSRQLLEKQSVAGVNNFVLVRELTPTDKQSVVRMNRDT